MKYEDVKVGLILEDDKGKIGTVTKKLKTKATMLFRENKNGMAIDTSKVLLPADFARFFPASPASMFPGSEKIRAYKSFDEMLNALKITIKAPVDRIPLDPFVGYDFWRSIASTFLDKDSMKITKEERNAVKSTVMHLMYSPNKKVLKKEIKHFLKSVQNED